MDCQRHVVQLVRPPIALVADAHATAADNSLVCNRISVTSFPLLVFAALGLVPKVLEHLAMSEVDLPEAIVQRGTTYILVFAFVSDVFRCVTRA
jgi:hypothetical protein